MAGSARPIIAQHKTDLSLTNSTINLLTSLTGEKLES